MSTLNEIIQGKIALLLPQAKTWLKRQSEESFRRIETNIYMLVLSVGAAYISADIVGGVISSSLVSSVFSSQARISVRADDLGAVMLDRPVMANTRELQETIKNRNIFNSEGKFPEEKFGGAGGGSRGAFDMNAPCNPISLPIELVGTIYLGDPSKSIATVKDKNYSEADVYRAGDAIYGNEQAIVAAVERQKIVINNNGSKECIVIEDKVPNQNASDGFPAFGGGDFASLPTNPAGAGSEITLEAGYVEGELGPGFGKIVDAARLVPNPVDGGGINGFRMFSIKAGTLFSRVGFQNGDVITRVNDTSMTQPEQGFALYQAFQDEKEVRIQLLRGGSTPLNITVRIK
jgi:general secretion pathway protein C